MGHREGELDVTCGVHSKLETLTDELTGMVRELSYRVVELEKTIKLLRNAALLLIGVLLGTGILQVKEIFMLIGKR
jgi:hypothetical protein